MKHPILNALLDRRNDHPEQIKTIDDEIWQRFGRTLCVCVLDMTGFSRLTVRYGITHYLAMIRRMHKNVVPVVEHFGGRLVKAEADNLYVTFDQVDMALQAAIEVQNRLGQANIHLPEDWDLYVSIGMDYGRVLMIETEDMFGEAVNTASKLGEDIAERSEILLSDAAYQQLSAKDPAAFEQLEWTLSNVTLVGFRLRPALPPK